MSVYVVSWHVPDSCGGFNWYWDESAADEAFDLELRAWGGGATIRLVEYPVETVPARDDATARQRLTDEIDGDLAAVEIELPAIRQEYVRV